MKRNWASELRAIADGRLMLNVRNGVTVSRSMLAMIADEIDAMRAAPLTPAEAGGLVERLRGIPVKWIDLRLGEEAADAIEALSASLAFERAAHEAKDAVITRLTAEKDAAEFAARNSKSLDGDAIHAVRELLNSAGVPKAAFIDDHVGNAIAQRDAERAAHAETKRERDEHKRLKNELVLKAYPAMDGADDLIEALGRYGFPVSDAAEPALMEGGSREAQALHKAAKAFIAARRVREGDQK